MPTTFLNPEGISKPMGYTHVAKVSGAMVFIAGQVALDAQGNLVGFDDFRQQTEQVFRNLATALGEVRDCPRRH